MKQPAARPVVVLPGAAPAGSGGAAAVSGRPTTTAHAGPSLSQGSVQPSGSVLTASRAPKVRIKLPRSSGGGSSGGGAATTGSGATGAGSEEPAAKKAKQ